MKMRNLSVVIDRLLAVIPETEKQVRAGLEDVKSSYAYTAPEHHVELWRDAMYILSAGLGEPDTDWKKEVSDIFSARK